MALQHFALLDNGAHRPMLSAKSHRTWKTLAGAIIPSAIAQIYNLAIVVLKKKLLNHLREAKQLLAVADYYVKLEMIRTEKLQSSLELADKAKISCTSDVELEHAIMVSSPFARCAI
ncbi:MAG: hypothetical protein FRX49_02758 [Trebouxia sp. A1-2]|nr:MAG: hypothetical protein FRX49_02758 [Trebouxia sp. A1-2]